MDHTGPTGENMYIDEHGDTWAMDSVWGIWVCLGKLNEEVLDTYGPFWEPWLLSPGSLGYQPERVCEDLPF